MSRPRRSSAGYLVGWLLFATAGLRALIFYGGKPALPTGHRTPCRVRAAVRRRTVPLTRGSVGSGSSISPCRPAWCWR